MNKNLLTNMLAAIAALFTLMFALPQKAMAQQNTVTIDGVKKTILSTKFIGGYGDDNAFVVYLYLSSDKKEYVNVSGNKNLHAIYDHIWLNKKEEKHEGQWYWGVSYTKNGYGKELFDAYANPDNDHAVFTNGYMSISGDPRVSRKVCGISLYNGKITDTKHGDGQEHTIRIDYKHERTEPSAGTFTVGTVTGTSIDLSWTHGSDETTPRDKLHYIVEYQKKGDSGWHMPHVGNATSYTIKGLEPETEYEVNILVQDESGNYKRYGVQTVTTKKATATKYDLWIAGVQVTSDNRKDLSSIPGVSGKVKYDHSIKTLFLNGAKIETTADVYGIDSKIDGLTIEVTGDNTIKVGGFSAIRNTESRCTIEGGTLKVSGRYFGLYVMNKASMTIDNCNVESDGSVGTNNNNAKMTIRNSKLTAKKKSDYASMMGIKELTLEGCAITQPTGAKYDASLKGVALNGKLVESKVVIEPTEKYGIFIGGVEITADNYTDISASNGFPAVKSGTVSYNPATRTLTLDNAVIEMESGYVIRFIDGDMSHAYTLVLKGNGNRLTSASYSTLLTCSNLTITGGGSAQMTSRDNFGIFVSTDATLTITGGCSITAEGKYGIAGRVGSSGTLIIDGATLKAKGTSGSVCYFKEIQLKNCAITAPSGATIERGSVRLNGSVCTKQVVIEPTEKYGIKIGGVRVTSANCNDISASNGFPAVKSGTVSYNPETRTLTLDNAVIEGGIYNAIWFTDEDMSHAYTLVLKGNGNRLTSSSAALATRSNLTITGGGSAQMTSEEDCGILVGMDATLTITGGCSITAEGAYGIAGQDGNSATLIIDGATVKAKGNGTEGSIFNLKEIQLKNCAITAPSGATVEGGKVMLGGKVCKEQVTIEPIGTGIDTPTADVPARKQGVYNLQGVRLGTSLDRLPKGIYIKDGKKVIKK